MKTKAKAKATKKPDRFDGKKNEWITPKPIVDAFARAVGSKWMDPFSPPDNPLGADLFITEEQNSLGQPWPDEYAVWANPPFSAGQLRPCLQRLYCEWMQGRPGMLLLPINNRCETGYYQELCLCDALSAIVFVRGRVSFEERITDGLFVHYQPKDENLYATHILAYNIPAPVVAEAFAEIGRVVPVGFR